MPDNLQTTQSGAAELKNYYDPYNSIYEAIKRRRKKRMETQGIDLPDEQDFEKQINPDR